MNNRVSIFFLLILVTLLSNLAWGQDVKAPEIFFKEKNFIAGEVLEGTLVEHSYTVYNRGNSELKILNVRTG